MRITDHNDFIWDRVSKIPLPPAPPGEKALEALDRLIGWLRIIYTDKAIPQRYRVLAAWDALSPEQKAELKDVNIFDRRHPWKKIDPANFDELPFHSPIERPHILVPYRGPVRRQQPEATRVA